MERLHDVPEVAAILRVTPSTIYTWTRQGQLPYVRVGRLIRFTPEQITEFLARSGTAGKATEALNHGSCGRDG